MGDYSNLTVDATVSHPDVQQKVKEAFEEYSGGSDHYVEDIDGGGVMIGANDVRVGSVEELDADLRRLIDEGFDKGCDVCDGTGTVTDRGGFMRKDCDDCDASGEVHVDVDDFPYSIHDDPLYEWLGTIIIHVPGLEPDFRGQCDSEGNPTVTGGDLIERVEKAMSLEEVREFIAVLTGATHTAAWAALTHQESA